MPTSDLEQPNGAGSLADAAAADRVVRNSAFNLTGQGIYALLHLLSIVILARALGTETFGQYYTIFALILVVQLLAETGLSTILTGRLVRNPHEHRQIISEGASLFVCVALASAAVMMLVGLGFVWWQRAPALAGAFAAAGVGCAGIQVQRFGAGVLQGSELFGYENVARVMQGAVFAGFALLFVTTGHTQLITIVAMLAASHWVAAVFLLATLHNRGHLTWPSRRLAWRSWLSEAGPLGFGDLIRGLTWQLDTVLLGILQPAAVVGIYSVAYRPLGPLNYVPRAILSASFPSFTRLAADQAALQTAFAQSARVLMIVSVPIAVTIFLCAEPFVRLVAGPEYVEAAVPLRFLIWITVLSFLTMHFRYVLAALGRQPTYAWLVVGVFALEASIEMALIPAWGYMGACVGSLLGELIFAGAGLALCRRSGVYGLQWTMVARAVVAGAVMGAVLWFARETSPLLVILLGAIAIGMYFVLCVWLGALRKEEVREFRGAVRRLLRPATRPV